MCIYIKNIKYALRDDPNAMSIAIQDQGKPNSISCLMPTWEMVGGIKKYQGIETKIRCNGPLSYDEYIAAYRHLLLVERKREVRAWVASLEEYKQEFHHLHLYCYCRPITHSFNPRLDAVEDNCHEWFCHRWLVYKLIKSWKPQLHVHLT